MGKFLEMLDKNSPKAKGKGAANDDRSDGSKRSKNDSKGSGFPIWAIVIIALGALALVGGCIAYRKGWLCAKAEGSEPQDQEAGSPHDNAASPLTGNQGASSPGVVQANAPPQ